MDGSGLGTWPARRAAISPDRVALVHEGTSWTYAEVSARVGRVAARLRAAGVGPGDRVAYLGPNHPAFVETMFAAYALGAIFVPLNFRLTEPEIGYQLADSGARLLVVDPSCAPAVPASIRVLPREELGSLPGPGPGLEPRPAGMDEPACILYTSGTTGRPKGCVLTHANVIWNCYNVLVGMDVGGDEVTLTGAPLFHVAALNQCLLPTFLKGGRSVIMPAWDVDACFDLIAAHRVTWMFGVTTMFAALARSARWPTADLSSVRSLISGGAPIPGALIEAYQDRGLTFCQGYGLTETAPGATFLEAPESQANPGSAGLPVFFAEVRCVRPDLTPVDAGEPGEVQVRGPNVTSGYWRDPRATAEAFAPGGWFRSGDIATVDDGGHYRIVDRLKDMFVSGGENVYPAEVEAALFEHPAVAEVAVVGVPDAVWGEVGRAFVVVVPGGDLPDLREFLRGRLAKYKIPRYVTELPALPKTGSNKVRKAPLRDLPL